MTDADAAAEFQPLTPEQTRKVGRLAAAHGESLRARPEWAELSPSERLAADAVLGVVKSVREAAKKGGKRWATDGRAPCRYSGPARAASTRSPTGGSSSSSRARAIATCS